MTTVSISIGSIQSCLLVFAFCLLIFMHTFLQGARYGVRMLLGKPGLASVAVIELAVGIGAKTAVFS